MKIYTRQGDGGETGLFGGARVPKDHPRVRAYGDLDEACAAAGMAVALLEDGEALAVARGVLCDLMALCAVVAAPPGHEERMARRLEMPVDDARIAALEGIVDRLEGEMPPLTSFILPTGSPAAAALHVMRSTLRRAERSLVSLNREEPLPPVVMRYVNRASDLAFVLARAVDHRAGRPAEPWKPTRPAGGPP
jgi:cob(I)alamin adenosyltransferase